MGKKIVDEDMRLNIKINGNEAKMNFSSWKRRFVI